MNIAVLDQPGAREVKYGLPTEIVFCKSCVISNQRPITALEAQHGPDHKKATTNFDADGVCDACRWAAMKESEIDWNIRRQELESLLRAHRSPSGDYDVVVPGSGGKDSAYVAHVLKHEYGMHPLTVTWAPNLYTDIGWQNLQNFIAAGFENILFTPNGAVHRLLTRLAFLNLGHPFQPFILGQRSVAPKVAAKYGIRLVFYGENVAEYGNRIEDNFEPKMARQLYASRDMGDPNLLIAGNTVAALREAHGLSNADLAPYADISAAEAEQAGIDVHYMSYYLKWVPQENYYYVVENTGFTPNTERTEGSFTKYSGIDDRIDPFHYYLSLVKFGMGRATADAAQEIRTDKITRDEGVALVRRFDTEFPAKYFREFLDYLDIDEDQFWATVDGLRSPHLWTKQDNEWTLRHPVE